MKYLGLIKLLSLPRNLLHLPLVVDILCPNYAIICIVLFGQTTPHYVNDVHNIFCTSQANKLPKELKERP